MAPPKIFALDLGTTKFCLATLQSDQSAEGAHIPLVSVEAKGMRRGMLSDFKEAQLALNGLLEKAENELNTCITRVSVGIAGSHLVSEIDESHHSFLPSLVINEKVLGDIEKSIANRHTSPDRGLLHTLPLSFNLDHRDPVTRPLGLSCSSLKARHLLIKADKHYLRDVVRLCNSCGLQVEKMIAEPYASSSVILDQEKKELGVAVADIGGGTTDCIIFEEGLPVKVFTINIGGKIITSDLAIGLNLPQEEAEQAKIKIGLSLEKNPSLLTNHTPNQEQVQKVLRPRINELGEFLSQECQKSEAFLGSGIILTGGGSEIRELVPYLSERLSYTIHKSRPGWPSPATPHEGTQNQALASKYATVVGLLHLEHQRLHSSKTGEKSKKIASYFRNFLSWVKELS